MFSVKKKKAVRELCIYFTVAISRTLQADVSTQQYSTREMKNVVRNIIMFSISRREGPKAPASHLSRRGNCNFFFLLSKGKVIRGHL